MKYDGEVMYRYRMQGKKDFHDREREKEQSGNRKSKEKRRDPHLRR